MPPLPSVVPPRVLPVLRLRRRLEVAAGNVAEVVGVALVGESANPRDCVNIGGLAAQHAGGALVLGPSRDGSKWYCFMAFSWVILFTAASSPLANSASSDSGAFGHVESE